MKRTFNRRSVTRAGRTLNTVADFLRRYSEDHGVTAETAQEVEDAVRLVNAVAYQYFLIPRTLREEHYREELVPDGVRMHLTPEE